MQLRMNNVHKFYGEGDNRVEVLRGINCEVNDGEICVLLGPSGSGKSTLLNIIGGIESADEGCIDIGEDCTSDMSENDLTLYRRDHLGFVFQFYNLIPNLTVKENIEVCAYLSKEPLEINELLKTLGLYEHKDKLPSQLSGGQQQRVAVARALVTRPKILFCDEPTGNLNFTIGEQVIRQLVEVAKGKSLIAVTHDDRLAKYFDAVIDMNEMTSGMRDMTSEEKEGM